MSAGAGMRRRRAAACGPLPGRCAAATLLSAVDLVPAVSAICRSRSAGARPWDRPRRGSAFLSLEVARACRAPSRPRRAICVLGLGHAPATAPATSGMRDARRPRRTAGRPRRGTAPSATRTWRARRGRSAASAGPGCSASIGSVFQILPSKWNTPCAMSWPSDAMLRWTCPLCPQDLAEGAGAQRAAVEAGAARAVVTRHVSRCAAAAMAAVERARDDDAAGQTCRRCRPPSRPCPSRPLCSGQDRHEARRGGRGRSDRAPRFC